MHINYYSIVRKSNTRSELADLEKDHPNSDIDSDDDNESSDPSLFTEGLKPCPGRPDWAIKRCIISLHFLGDLNDRYWTSHVFVDEADDWDWLADDRSFELSNPSGQGNKNIFHSQRKIMEARWFAKLLARIVDETNYILSTVSEVIGKNVCQVMA